MKQRPSFQFYPQDFLSSVDVQSMTAEEVGCYCLLLFNCYNNGGSLPKDEEKLKKLCRGSACAMQVLYKFYAKDNLLRHKRIDKELEKQENYSEKRREAALSMWDKKKKEKKSKCNASAMQVQCSSSSSSSSSLNKENKTKETIDYPEWLDLPLWREFKNMRVRIKKPMTPYAEKRALNKLKKIMDEGYFQADILNRSIDNGWKGLFPPKDKQPVSTEDQKIIQLQEEYNARQLAGKTNDPDS